MENNKNIETPNTKKILNTVTIYPKSILEENDDDLTVDIYSVGKPVAKKTIKKLISFRIEESYITKAKEIATKKGIGYQTLFRMWIIEQLNKA